MTSVIRGRKSNVIANQKRVLVLFLSPVTCDIRG